MRSHTGLMLFAALTLLSLPAAAQDRDRDRPQRQPEEHPSYKDFHKRPIYIPRDSDYWDRYVDKKERPRRGYDPGIQVPIIDVFSSGVVNRLTQSARQRHQQSYEQAMTNPSGQTVTWTDMGGFGSVTVSAAASNEGRSCRTVTQTVSASGASDSASNIVCLGTDGRWQLSQ